MNNHKTLVYEGLEWMAEDFEIDGNIYFNWEEVVANCPEGWRIPTIEEWETAHVKMMGLNGNGCIYEKENVPNSLGRSYYWSSSPYIAHDGETDERLGMGIYVKGGRGINEHFFFKKSYYPIRYVRDYVKKTYVVLFGRLDCDDNYITSIAYAGNDQKAAYELSGHPDFDSVSIWVDGEEVRAIEEYQEQKPVPLSEIEWMAEDFEVDGNIYFTYKEAIKNCPEGWRLPSINDFYELELENELHILNNRGVLIDGTKSWNCPVYLVEVTFKSGDSGQFAFYVRNNRLYSEIFSEDVKIPVRYVKEKQAQ